MAQTPPSTPPPPPGLAATVFYEAASATGFFRTGAFLSFLESGEHSDIKVVGPDGSERRLHRMVICAHSGFFRAALKHEFKESADAEVRPLGASVTAKEGKMLPIGGIGELKLIEGPYGTCNLVTLSGCKSGRMEGPLAALAEAETEADESDRGKHGAEALYAYAYKLRTQRGPILHPIGHQPAVSLRAKDIHRPSIPPHQDGHMVSSENPTATPRIKLHPASATVEAVMMAVLTSPGVTSYPRNTAKAAASASAKAPSTFSCTSSDALTIGFSRTSTRPRSKRQRCLPTRCSLATRRTPSLAAAMETRSLAVKTATVSACATAQRGMHPAPAELIMAASSAAMRIIITPSRPDAAAWACLGHTTERPRCSAT